MILQIVTRSFHSPGYFIKYKNDPAFYCFSQGSWPAFYSGGSLGRAHREFSLDPHHTHFVLVDDGTVKQFTSVEASFRAQVESAISKIGTLVGYGKNVLVYSLGVLMSTIKSLRPSDAYMRR